VSLWWLESFMVCSIFSVCVAFCRDRIFR
jgi:hypothetical protein